MVEIKNKNTGLTLLLLSGIIYGSTLISASIYSQILTGEGFGWNRRYGIFGTALLEVGTVPLILAVLLGIVGIVIIVIQERKS